jgi:preprotein translocase subunit SecA
LNGGSTTSPPSFASKLRDAVDAATAERLLTAAVGPVRDAAAQLADRAVADLRDVLDRAVAADDVVAANAVAAEVVRRRLGVTLHDGQVTAGLALSTGWTVQMRTGEGKTFAAIAPALFHARRGPVHVVTANAYLASRDADWSGSVLRALGVTTGALVPGAGRPAARAAYAADVTFGAGMDFGFDFLRDHLFLTGDEPVQRGRHFAIVDEADAVLIDQARTPLVLSAPAHTRNDPVARADAACRMLRLDGDVVIDEVHRRIDLTDEGARRCEQLLGVDNLYAPGTVDWPHLVQNALRARALLRRDRDYVVVDGSVRVVDELTGRIVDARRWGDGLHQAVEAKEQLSLTLERRPVGRVTVGGFFGGYHDVVGMSGTLEGAADELAEAYGLRLVVIPTHRPVVRVDRPDVELPDQATKFQAVADDVAARRQRGQPVLVGTVSIEQTQAFAQVLAARGVAHRTLSAKNDAEEAALIATAGHAGTVTVATQMAGRGVDIVLGHGVAERGGLMVWGLEHHPALRLDMQLRGRAGRQGDPGETCFAVCPTDLVLDQDETERADRELRDDVREMDWVVDSLQRHLYAWREHVAAGGDLAGELAPAVETAATAAIDRLVALGGVPLDGLPWWPSSRQRRAEARVRDALDARRSAVGDGLFEGAARALLRHLLVALWSDALEALDYHKHVASLGVVFGTGRQQGWKERAVRSYATFERSVRIEWVRQLLACSIVAAGAGAGAASPARPDHAEEIVLPAVDEAPGPADAEAPLLGTWDGWSFNRAVRERFGTRLPEAPVVLTIDAIGDRAGGSYVLLDLDDPSGTVVSVAR